MKWSFLIKLFKLLIIVSVVIFVFVYGMNRVSYNMNKIYTSSSGNGIFLDSKEDNKAENVREYIPLFFVFESPQSNIYRLMVMGKGVQVDISGLVELYESVKGKAITLFNSLSS